MNVRRAYYLISSLNWFGAVLPMAVMVLLAQERGLDLAQIGLYLGLYSLTIMVLELPSGAFADAAGRKQAVLIAYALAAASRLVFLLAFDLAVFLIYAVLAGVSRALSSGALEAWFIDALQADDPDAELQPALAAGNSYQLLGLALGTMAGGALPRLFAHLPSGDGAVLTPLSTTVAGSVALHLGVLALTALVMREARPAPALGRAGFGVVASLRAGLGTLGAVIADAAEITRRSRTLWLLLAADLVVGLALTASELLWQPFSAGTLGAGAADTLVLGAVLAGCFGMGLVGNLVATPLSRLLGQRYALVAGLFQLLQGASFVILAWQTELVLATAWFWLTYVTRSAWSSPHATLFNQQVPAQRRSVMLSVQSLVAFGGSLLGSVALGGLAQQTSIALAWTLTGGLLLLSVGLYLALDRAREPRGAVAPGPREPAIKN